MEKFISFTNIEWITLLGLCAELVDHKVLYYQYSKHIQKLHGAPGDYDNKVMIRNMINDTVQQLDRRENWTELYIFIVVISGRTYPQYLTPIFEIYTMPDIGKLSTSFCTVGKTKKLLHKLIDIGAEQGILSVETISLLKYLKHKKTLEITNQSKKVFKLIM